MVEQKKGKTIRTYNGIAVDSQEEMMAIMYFEELIEAGYVEKLERAESIGLSERLENKYTQVVEMKTKTKKVEKNQVLLEEHIYTPEFVVTWNINGQHAFADTFEYPFPRKFKKPFVEHDGKSWIEVKPSFDQNNMTRLFVINRKWCWDKHNIFINLVQPHKLFEETFTPKAWLTTATGKQRVIHWKVKSLEEYVNSLINKQV
jgi:hypothetical protein